jgi:CDP-glucose 4,6-dehydratase
MDSKYLFGGSFEGKTVLVTGHTGFKGAWLSLWLRELSAQVIGYSLNPPTQPNLFEQSGLASKIKSIHGDVRDGSKLREVIGEFKPEIVFHLAAQPLVRQSYVDPIQTIDTNVLGTAQLLEVIRATGSSVRVCQVITSDKCYENEEDNQPRIESDKLGGRDPYSASKACAEILVNAYRSSFFSSSNGHSQKISISSVRAGNVIGGGDWGKDRLIPDCVRALSDQKSILIRNPKSTRPWQFILDVLAGYLRLAEQQLTGSDLYAQAWNFGPEVSQVSTVEDLTKKIISAWGSGQWIFKKSSTDTNESFFPEAQLLRLDPEKARKWLGWKPMRSLDESINETIRWYRDLQGATPEKVYSYTVSQINQYTDTAKKERQPWALQEKILR